MMRSFEIFFFFVQHNALEIRCRRYQFVLPFYWWVVFHGRAPQFVKPVTYCRTFGLLPLLATTKKSCCEHLCTGFCVHISSHFLCDKCLKVWLLSHMVLCLIFKETTQQFSRVTVLFHIPISNCERYSFSASSPTFGIVTILHFSTSNRSIVISLWSYFLILEWPVILKIFSCGYLPSIYSL